jgi:flagellar protein FliS
MFAYHAPTSYNQYSNNNIAQAKPEELTLMLYNGLIKFIMRAQDAVSGHRMEEAHTNIVKAQNIVQEFLDTLDRNYEVAATMELVYDYMYRRLIDANVEKSEPILVEVLGFAKELRDTWEQAMKLSKKPQRQEQPAVTAQ